MWWRMPCTDCMEKHVTDWGKIKNVIKDALSDFLWKTDEEKSYDPADHYGSLGEKKWMRSDSVRKL